ncbi:MAG: hypothetical protein VXB01_16910, partial [Opitutae bacterium]
IFFQLPGKMLPGPEGLITLTVFPQGKAAITYLLLLSRSKKIAVVAAAARRRCFMHFVGNLVAQVVEEVLMFPDVTVVNLRHSKMCFAKYRSTVTGILNISHVARAGRLHFMTTAPDTVRVNIFTAEQRGPGRHAQGRTGLTIPEQHPFSCQTIQMGRYHDTVSSAPKRVTPVLI